MAVERRKFGMNGPLGEIIFEYVPADGLLRLNVVHVATGVEVSLFGPAGAAGRELEQLGRAKLRYRLIREFGGGGTGPVKEIEPSPKRGVVA